MYLARAHRLGPVKRFAGIRKRPIIVNFRDYCDTQYIMSNAHLLRGTPFSVDHDLPKEISAARKLLWDEIKSIKRSKPSAKCQIIYPAKLSVDGKIVGDEFPDWSEALRGSRLGDFSHIEETVFSIDIHDQTPATYREGVNGVPEVETPFDRDSATTGVTRDPDPDETLPPGENDTNDADISDPRENDFRDMDSTQSSQSVISSKDDLPNSTNSTNSNPLFRPFSVDMNSKSNTENPTKTLANLEIPKHVNRESRAKERGGLRRVHSLSLPREHVKTGTSKDVKTKSKSKNSAAGNPSRDLATNLAVTSQGANNLDSVIMTDDNNSNPSENKSNELC